MKTRRFYAIGIAVILCLGAASYRAQAQEPTSRPISVRKMIGHGDELDSSKLLAQARPNRRSGFSFMSSSWYGKVSGPAFSIVPMAAGPNLTVLGGGTLGRLTKWTGFTSSNSFIGDSTIFEDKFGKVGIGTDMPTSKLTVAGLIETTSGGVKFPDGTVQTSSAAGALFTVAHDATLIGDGTPGSPLSVVQPEALIEPVSARKSLRYSEAGTGSVDLFTVPAGKRLVLEHASARCTAPIGQKIIRITIVTVSALTGIDHALVPTYSGDSSDVLSYFNASQQIKLYAAPSEIVKMVVDRNANGGGEVECICSFSGFLVTLPAQSGVNKFSVPARGETQLASAQQ